MPWLPEINLALERARQAQVRSALADPVGAFIWAVEGGDPHGIEGPGRSTWLCMTRVTVASPATSSSRSS